MFVRKFLILIFLCSAVISNAQSGDSLNIIPTNYALVICAGAGVSYYGSEPGVPTYLHVHTTRISPSGSIRLMWYPDHRLRFGLETGYTTLYNYKITDAGLNTKVNLIAIPLLIEWSMQIGDRINIFAGTGTYLVKTTLDYLERSTSTQLNLGWVVAASYIIPVSKDVSINPEIKWLDAEQSQDQTFNFQLMVAWKFFKW